MSMTNSKLFLNYINIRSVKLGTSDIRILLGEDLDYPLTSNVSITYDVAAYNGMLQTAQNIIVIDNSGNTLVQNIDYVVTENNGGINAGEYDLVLTLIGQYQGTASTKFVINKVTPTVVAPTAKVLTYNGSAQELTNAGSTDFGTLKYSIDGINFSTTVPSEINGGSYAVYYRVDGDSNVNDVEAQSIACSINEKQVTATVELSQSTYTYNGSELKPTVIVKDGSTVIPSSEYIVTYSNNINVGTGTVTISDNIGGNYNVIGSANFTINKATPSVVAPTAKVLAYNGSAQELINHGSTNFGTLKYSIDGINYSTTVPSETECGNYTVYYRVDGDSNVNDVEAQSIACSIIKGNSSLSFSLTNVSISVNDVKSNIVNVNAGDGVVTYLSNDTSVVTADNNGNITGITFGDAIVTASISSTEHYNSASTSYNVHCALVITSKVNVTNTSSRTKIANSLNSFSSIEIDGVQQQSVNTGYTFDTIGEHTIKYYLKDTTIGDSAFYNCSGLTSIEIPNSVTSIGTMAFYNCHSLTSIEIPSSVTSIGDYTFSYCSGLTSCTIGSGVTSIGEYAFHDCTSLTSIEIPDGVTSIGSNAFASCGGLTSIEILDSVTSIGSSAFTDCRSLTSAVINSGSIGNSAFQYCGGLTSFTLGSGVTSIGNSAFYNCSGLTSIEIPDSVTSIGDSAFRYCSGLTSCIIGNGVTSIGNYTFYLCTSLTSCTLGSGVTSIGDGTFGVCSALTSIELPDGVTSIGTSAFTDCKSLASINIPDGVTSIGDYAFVICSALTSIEIPSSVTSIGYDAFSNCYGLTSCTIGSGVTSIGEYAFYNCSGLTSIEIPDGVTSIENSTFGECSGLTSCTIGSGVTSIGNYAFQDCNGLTSINIPEGVTSIGYDAFWNCTSLTSINIPDGVTSIGNGAFSYCSGLTNIEIPDGVTSIGNSTFNNCFSLTSCTIGSGVTSIGNSAFHNCSGLTSIELPEGVTSIGSNVFRDCYGLTSITSNAVTAPTILSNTFYDIQGGGTLYVPLGSSGYNVWMQNTYYYLGLYHWTKVEQ